MKVLQTPIEKLIPYIRNPRKNEQAINKVAGSISEFGFKQPIVVDSDMVIIAGHTRLMAAQQLELEKVPVVIASDLTKAQVKAYRIADNRTAQESSWDFDLLKIEMEDLVSLDFDLLGTAFDQAELDDMLRIGNEGLTDPDDVPEVPEEPTTEPGDIYILGNHRLMCGDSTNTEEVERLMNGHKADMVFTDPPYGLGGYGGRNNMNLLGDDGSEEDITKLYQSISDAQEIYIWGRVENYKNIGFEPRDVIIWKKNNFGLGRGYRGQYEVCFYKGNFDGSDSDVWEVNKDSKYVHPTQKPVELACRAINNSNPTIVEDLFGGSGSTLIACEKTGRHCYMMELDPRYCDVIVKRWEDYTGKEAEKIKLTRAIN